MKDLTNAKELLSSGNYTCVLCSGDTIHTTTERGVKPLVRWLTDGTDLQGFCAADKVVGKATAYLYCLLGVKAVWGAVMSKGAIQALRSGGIDTHWEQQVDHIVNRAGNGPCPMEAATAQIDDPPEALTAIRETLQKLRS